MDSQKELILPVKSLIKKNTILVVLLIFHAKRVCTCFFSLFSLDKFALFMHHQVSSRKRNSGREVIMVDPLEAKKLAAKEMERIKAKERIKVSGCCNPTACIRNKIFRKVCCKSFYKCWLSLYLLISFRNAFKDIPYFITPLQLLYNILTCLNLCC